MDLDNDTIKYLMTFLPIRYIGMLLCTCSTITVDVSYIAKERGLPYSDKTKLQDLDRWERGSRLELLRYAGKQGDLYTIDYWLCHLYNLDRTELDTIDLKYMAAAVKGLASGGHLDVTMLDKIHISRDVIMALAYAAGVSDNDQLKDMAIELCSKNDVYALSDLYCNYYCGRTSVGNIILDNPVIAVTAARYGHILILRGITDWSDIHDELPFAAGIGGNIECINYILGLCDGKYSSDTVISGAASVGDDELIDLVISKYGMCNKWDYLTPHLIDLLVSNCRKLTMKDFNNAVKRGQVTVVTKLISLNIGLGFKPLHIPDIVASGSIAILKMIPKVNQLSCTVYPTTYDMVDYLLTLGVNPSYISLDNLDVDSLRLMINNTIISKQRLISCANRLIRNMNYRSLLLVKAAITG